MLLLLVLRRWLAGQGALLHASMQAILLHSVQVVAALLGCCCAQHGLLAQVQCLPVGQPGRLEGGWDWSWWWLLLVFLAHDWTESSAGVQQEEGISFIRSVIWRHELLVQMGRLEGGDQQLRETFGVHLLLPSCHAFNSAPQTVGQFPTAS
jgi:hypothetical protein